MKALHRLLDTTFEIQVWDEWALAHVEAFMRAYQSSQQAPDSLSGRSIRQVQIVQVDHPGESLEAENERQAVHRSKHLRWSFDATTHFDRPGWWFWEGRDFCVRREAPAGVPRDVDVPEKWEFAVIPEGDKAAAGEALFHLLRSLAIVSRDVRGTRMLHASGVVRPDDGRAVLFTGSVSAGKTTLMTYSVLAQGAVPLTNDRAWLLPISSDGRAPLVQSWPSYASYCEGTLLQDPRLEQAALEFERGASLLRVSSHNEPLRPRFDKDTKRIYPMSWFTDVLGSRYAIEAELGVVALCKVDPAFGTSSARDLDPIGNEEHQKEIVDVLSAEQFDDAEESFLRWHGLELSGEPLDVCELVETCAKSGVRFVSVHASPADLSIVKGLL